ncbi:MAG: hypothetical protein KDA27_27340 [Candidatus Eisenbacteria bacterium]|uniref:T9SS type A sorting domain-containing protein n=1 Tax=Eiseniibacteriota bacterium TaxID=2212470 RepID=A0A956NM08_UNCEI|nr:hypothetical protein [Candidatus Eisenbacteria bacterium]
MRHSLRPANHTLGILIASLVVSTAARGMSPDLIPSWGHPSPQGNGMTDYEFVNDDVGFAVGEAGSVLATTNAGVDWTFRSNIRTFGKDLYGVDTEDGVNLIAVGEAPGVFLSTDGGVTWTEVANPSTGTLLQLREAPDGRLDAAGENGEVIRSTDDGATWTSIGPGLGTIESQWWESAQHGWVVGQDVAHETTDGGATWTQFIDIAFFGFHEVQFYDPTFGRVLEDFGYWTTTDAGASWTREDVFTEPLYPRKTLPITPDHWLLITFIEGAAVYETFDRGETWDLLTFQNSVGFLDIEQASNGRVFFSSDVGDLFYSDDLAHTSSNSTSRLDPGGFGPVNVIATTPGDDCYAIIVPSQAGAQSSWMRSSDLGSTWSAFTGAAGLFRPSVMVWPTTSIGIVGAYESIARTTDAGASWNTITLPNAQRVTGIGLAEDRIFHGAYVVQSGDGTVYRSDDQGASWNDVGTSFPFGFAPWIVSFLDRDNGYVAGVQQSGSNPFNRLYRTANGGASWTLLSSPPGGFIRDMHWFDLNTGVASLGTPGIYRTTDGGATWTQQTSLRAYELAFVGQVGFGTGGFYWEPTASTGDGGVTWQLADVPMSAPSASVVATRDGFLLGNQDSGILKLSGLDVAGIGNGNGTGDGTGGSSGSPFGSDALGSTGIRLRHAGAHPTHGPARFEMSIASPGKFELGMFDAAGRRVRSLGSAFRSAGTFQMEWDGRDERGEATPSGLYFMRVEGEHGAETLRVVRVRD